MAARSPSLNHRKILLTRLNGYKASNLAFHFLELGYVIVGTVRTSSASNTISSSPAFAPFIPRLLILVVPTITHDGSFNEAVKAVYAIFHLATPINFFNESTKDVLDPAVKGTVRLLEAAHTHAGSQLETFVYMSSFAALLDPDNTAYHHYTRESWNNSAEVAATKLLEDEEDPFSTLYLASKVLAEHAAFRFQNDVRPSFRIMSVVPAMVTGPPVLFPENAADLSGTIKPIWEVLSGACELPRKVGSGMFVDVRDLVEICRALIIRGGEGGRGRLIVVGGRAERRTMIMALRERFPKR